MHVKSLISLLLLAQLFFIPRTANAEQRKDWMVDFQKGGTFLNVDALFPGAQLMLEHRIPIYDWFNEVDLRLNSLITLPFYESQFDLDVRILIVTFGAGIGFQDTFRNQTFESDESIESTHRRRREYVGDFSNELFWFAEGRLNISIPLNDTIAFLNTNTVRLEDRPTRSYDWHTAMVHDGFPIESEAMVFLKHPNFGALAPKLQLLNFDLDEKRHTVVNFGFCIVTRPGFRRRDDILYLSMLFYGATLSQDIGAEDVYGYHVLFAPLTFNLTYRAVLDLNI